jgi:biotin-(acetyl-CoA carboxylase) ligase
MKTSSSQIGRLLDPKDGNVTLTTLQRAARSGGRSGQNWFERKTARICCAGSWTPNMGKRLIVFVAFW